MVVVVAVVLSRRVAVNQSKVMVSGHVMRYQNDTCVCPLGTVNVWASDESVDGEVEPIRAACAPSCTGDVTTAVEPVEVQPVSPLSNPPLTIALPAAADRATSSTMVNEGSPAKLSSWLSRVRV